MNQSIRPNVRRSDHLFARPPSAHLHGAVYDFRNLNSWTHTLFLKLEVEVDLVDVDLVGVDLIDVDLVDADRVDIDFVDVDLVGVDIVDVDLVDVG